MRAIQDTSSAPATNPLLVLIDLGHRARAAASADELAFLAVNGSRALLDYRQAALWFADGGVRALSGVVAVEANAPYAQWLQRLCKQLPNDAHGALALDAQRAPTEVAGEWHEWLPAHAVWLPFPGVSGHADATSGGLLLASDALPDPACFALLEEWSRIWHHAWLARLRPSPWRLAWRQHRERNTTRPWWRQWRYRLAVLALLALCLPVRLTVLAPGELVPADPATIRAPLDGVIDRFHVSPNEPVSAGQPLFDFDPAPLAARLDVAQHALATAETEYRQLEQLALSDSRYKGQLAPLRGKVSEKRTEADYLAEQLRRAQVVAPRNGIAIFDDPSEWIGRPVQTGERVMRVAAADAAEIEAWLPIGGAIPLADDAPVRLYLAATPFASLSGQLRYLGHDALPRPDGSYAYRLRAALDTPTDWRIGLKGTVKVSGGWVPLGYWVLRRPLAAIRQFVAL